MHRRRASIFLEFSRYKIAWGTGIDAQFGRVRRDVRWRRSRAVAIGQTVLCWRYDKRLQNGKGEAPRRFLARTNRGELTENSAPTHRSPSWAGLVLFILTVFPTAATPTSAQTEIVIWSADLTIRDIGTSYGSIDAMSQAYGYTTGGLLSPDATYHYWGSDKNAGGRDTVSNAAMVATTANILAHVTMESLPTAVALKYTPSGGTATDVTLNQRIAADQDKTIKEKVEFTDDSDYTESLTSDTMTLVLANVGLVLSKTALTPAEGESESYTVKLATQPTETVTAEIGGTAGTDLTLDKTRLEFTISNWATAQTVTVTAGEDDDAADDAATLTHTATGGDYASVTKDLPVTISDDDQRGIMISTERLVLFEGWYANYKVKLTSQPTETVTVEIDGTAGTDLTLDKTSLEFTSSNWATEQIMTMMAGQDEDGLQDPVVTLRHRATGGDYTGIQRTVRVTVLEDDPTPLYVANARMPEGAGAIVFEVKLSAPTFREIRTSYTTVGGTATEGTDYVQAQGTLVIPPLQTESSITVVLLDDDDAEMEETFSLRLNHVVGVDESVSLTATGTIVDDDMPSLMISAIGTSLVEGSDARFRLIRTGDLSTSLRVPVTIEETGDFLRSGAPRTIAFPPGAEQVLLTLRTEDDNLVERDGRILITVAESPDYEISGLANASLTVTDNDAVSALIITGDQVQETAGKIYFPVSLQGASAYKITVDWSTSDQSARAGEDYEAASGSVIFASGETAGTIEVTVLDDIIPEEDETFSVNLSNPVNAVLEVGSATGTITDDDKAVTITWLSRFGRTVASQVVEGVGNRLAGSHGGWSLTNTVGQAAIRSRNGSPASFGDLLGNGSFQVSTGVGSQDASPGGGGSFTAWGRGMKTDFGGADAGLAMDGSVLTGLAGIDYEQGRMLAGVALSYSLGDGSFGRTSEESGAEGIVESSLGSAYPYLRVRLADRLSAWGLGGHGRGDTSFRDASAAARTAGNPILMNMGAFGARGEVLRSRGGGFGLALKSDAFLVRMSSETGANAPLVMANAQRVRFLLEASSRENIGENSILRSTIEIGGRYDGGDGETGTGVEVGGGLKYANAGAGLRVDASLRILLAHEDTDFSEWGLGGTIIFEPGGPRRGLSMRMGMLWGVVESAIHDLWSPYATRSLTMRRSAYGGGPAGRIDARLHYGITTFGDRVAMAPYAEMRLDGETGTRTPRVGWLFNVHESLRLSLETDVGQEHSGQVWRTVTLRVALNR